MDKKKLAPLVEEFVQFCEEIISINDEMKKRHIEQYQVRCGEALQGYLLAMQQVDRHTKYQEKLIECCKEDNIDPSRLVEIDDELWRAPDKRYSIRDSVRELDMKTLKKSVRLSNKRRKLVSKRQKVFEQIEHHSKDRNGNKKHRRP